MILVLVSISVVMLFIPGTVSAQWTMGGRNIAMAQANTALPGDVWAVFHNPALISKKQPEFGFFAIRYYGLKEFEDHAAVLTIPLRVPWINVASPAGLSAGVHSFGFELYRETQFRAGWSRQFDRLSIGMALKYVHTRISGYGSTGAPLFDAGIAAELFQNITFGYRVTNIFERANGDGDLYPAEMAVGLSWNGLSGFILAADIVKDTMFPLTKRVAMEIEGIRGVYFRGGWTGNPFTWSAGTGLHISRFHINFAVQSHPILGLSPGVDISITM